MEANEGNQRGDGGSDWEKAAEQRAGGSDSKPPYEQEHDGRRRGTEERPGGWSQMWSGRGAASGERPSRAARAPWAVRTQRAQWEGPEKDRRSGRGWVSWGWAQRAFQG